MKKRIRLLAIFMSILLMTTLLGCNRTKEGSKASNTSTNPNKVVTIGYVAIQQAPPQPLIAREQKIFEDTLTKEGYTVKWFHERSLQKVWPPMDKGQIDFFYLPSNNVSTYVTETSQFGGSDKYRIIAGSLDHNFYRLVVKPNIKSLKDLDGKTVGIVNHMYQEEMMLNKQLETVGLKTKSLGGTVNVEYVDIMTEFFKNYTEKYAAISTWAEQEDKVLKDNPGSYELTNLNAGKFGDYIPQGWLVAKKDLIDNNPELVRLILIAHLKATQAAQDKKEQLPDLAAKHYRNYFLVEKKAVGWPDYPEPYFQKIWKDAIPTYDPHLRFIQDVCDFELKAGYLKKGKTVSDFVDLSLLNEALKESGKPAI